MVPHPQDASPFYAHRPDRDPRYVAPPAGHEGTSSRGQGVDAGRPGEAGAEQPRHAVRQRSLALLVCNPFTAIPDRRGRSFQVALWSLVGVLSWFWFGASVPLALIAGASQPYVLPETAGNGPRSTHRTVIFWWFVELALVAVAVTR